MRFRLGPECVAFTSTFDLEKAADVSELDDACGTTASLSYCFRQRNHAL